MIKKFAMSALVIFAMSSVFAETNHSNANKSKQMDPHFVKAMHAVLSWEIRPPFNIYGFGQWPEDHRIQKIIVHVNPTLPNSNERSGTVVFSCNGTSFTINPGETVICERALDNYAGLEILLGDKHTIASSAGTVQFIMEDIK